MAVASRITGHPVWTALQQAQQLAQQVPEQTRQMNPALVERTISTLEYLRSALEQVNGSVVSDGALNNFHSWTQQIATELQNSANNPGNAQFIQNLQGPVEAISQNAGQLPFLPGPTFLTAMVDEAQRRLDQMQTLETQVRERSRLVSDQIGEHLEAAQDATATGLRKAKENEDKANTLLAALGARASSSDYLVTANNEARSADRWRFGTIGAAILTGLASLLSGHDLNTHSAGAIAARTSIVLPLLLLTIYAGRQAAEHRSQQRRARSLGLQLASLGSFLSDLSDEGRNTIKLAIAQRLFAEDPSHPAADGYPSSQDLIKLLATTIGKFPQLR